MAARAYTGTTWDLVLRDVVLGGVTVTADTPGVAVTYALARNGVAVGSGSLAWEALGYTDAWMVRLTLPSTPGPLTALCTARATVDGAVVVGASQSSLLVE